VCLQGLQDALADIAQFITWYGQGNK